VGIPLAFKFTGIPFGIIMNCLCALGSIYAVWLLTRAKNIMNLTSYSEFGYICFGRASIFIINALVATATAGMPIAYFMIFGHICPAILKAIGINGFWSSQSLCCIVLAIALFWFYVQKQISEIKAAGFILLIGVVLFAIILAIKVMNGLRGEFDDDYSLWTP